jgi:hypothetical protein
VGLQALFTQPPPFEILRGEFLSSYHRYADALFCSYLESRPHRTISPGQFPFDLYASGDYTKMLETQWGGS